MLFRVHITSLIDRPLKMIDLKLACWAVENVSKGQVNVADADNTVHFVWMLHSGEY